MIELGRYIVGECGVLRHSDRRSQGVARQDIPGRRRRSAPPARRVGQLRPGDPTQLPGRDRRPRRRRRRGDRQRRRLPVHAARPARRRRRPAAGPRSATWSSSSRPAPTGSPPARPRSSAIRRPPRCSSSHVAGRRCSCARPSRPGRGRASRSAGVASLAYREPAAAGPRGVCFLVLVPAHNEAPVIGRCLEAIYADARPGDMVLVVADRCTDSTARVARRFGASVLARGPGDEPGRAAARQAGLEHARALDWDAVVMLDADSVIAPGFFGACERALAGGTAAVQARSEGGRGRTLATEASLAAFALQGITLPRGRDRLGLPVRLRGTGMAIRRRLALAHRFRAPASEDLVFTLDLLLDGSRCRHVDGARLRSEGANTWSTFGGQKVRYEAGRMAAARAYLPRLLKRAVASPRRRLSRGRMVSGDAAVRARRALPAGRDRARRVGATPGRWRRYSAPARSGSRSSSSPV